MSKYIFLNSKKSQLLKIVLLTGVIVTLNYHSFSFGRSSLSDLETRIERLEDKLESNLNLELTNKLDSLQLEVQELRGLLEEQQYATTTNNSIKQTINRNNPLPSSNINASFKPQPSIEDQQYSAKINTPQETDVTAYKSAYKLVEDTQFSEAITAFKDFLWQHNNSKYIPNATYWLGELYLTEHKFEIASDYFLQVVTKHKDHNKAPDALLKLGILEMERENWQEAKNYFLQIKNNYPNSSRVHMAEAKLQGLTREGH